MSHLPFAGTAAAWTGRFVRLIGFAFGRYSACWVSFGYGLAMERGRTHVYRTAKGRKRSIQQAPLMLNPRAFSCTIYRIQGNTNRMIIIMRKILLLYSAIIFTNNFVNQMPFYYSFSFLFSSIFQHGEN